jgi:hypothetical protein
MSENTEILELKSKGKLIFKDENGNILGERVIENIVVNNGRVWVLGAMNQTDTRYIASIDFGSGTAPASQTDTGVTTFEGNYPVIVTLNVSSRQLEITTQIPNVDLVGVNISEIALKLSDATAFNHAVFTPFQKSTTQVDVLWTIQY